MSRTVVRFSVILKSMNIIFPVLASVLQAGSFVIDKIALSEFKVGYKTYNVISWPLISLFSFIAFLIFKLPLEPELFSFGITINLLALVFLSVVTSIIFYRALKNDLLGEVQTIGLFKNIPIVIFSGIIFSDERNLMVISSAVVASVAIAWSCYDPKYHRFKIARKTLPYLASTLVFAPMIPILSKEILMVWHPVLLSLVRNIAIAIIFLVIYYKEIEKVSSKALSLLFLTNLLTTVAGILYFFSYKSFGIVYTILIFSLEPILVRLASIFFLKESFTYKKISAFVVVLASIVINQVIL